MLSKILRKNTSAGRVAGFLVSNFIGLAIVLGALQFYGDASSIWTSDDSFIKSDYIVLNKRVTSASTMTGEEAALSEAELSDLESQPWVRRVGRFQAAPFRVRASVGAVPGRGGGMSTQMFFESIPDDFIDVPRSQWLYRAGSGEVPIILPKDYLALYNFGFASAAGLPQLSEGMLGSVPVDLTLRGGVPERELRLRGRVAGFSNRLNTILVPQAFMEDAAAALGRGANLRQGSVRRVIVDVNSPGDVAIQQYIDTHDLEMAGDKRAGSAAYLLKVVTGLVVGVGVLITALSLLILILSVSLIMEKNRDKVRTLLLLGYPAGRIAAPYGRLVSLAAVVALLLAYAAVAALRHYYLAPLQSLGAAGSGIWESIVCGLALTGAVVGVNILYIHRRVLSAFR